MNLPEYMLQVGKQAHEAAQVLARIQTRLKNNAVEATAQQLEQQHEQLIAANATDLEAGKTKGLDSALLPSFRTPLTHRIIF